MANLKTSEKKTKAQSMGLHTEVLTGKTQQKFFNPDEAENGTIRKDFATNIQENAVHGSDSDENAKKEIGFFFSDSELIANN